MTDRHDTLVELAELCLSDAQRGYLLALEANRVDEHRAAWVQEVESQFQNRSHRKQIKGRGLATAHALIRKGIVKRRPEPCECGYHYVSLTPLGERAADALRARAAQQEAKRPAMQGDER